MKEEGGLGMNEMVGGEGLASDDIAEVLGRAGQGDGEDAAGVGYLHF